jgi:hypothetical protein
MHSIGRVTLATLALLLMLVSGLSHASPAEASASWCEADPIIEIGKSSFSVVTRVPRKALSRMTGDAHIVVIIPHGHPEVRVSYPYVGPFHERVSIVPGWQAWNPDGANTIHVSLFVPASARFPVQMVIGGDGGARLIEGVTGEWLTTTLDIRGSH